MIHVYRGNRSSIEASTADAATIHADPDSWVWVDIVAESPKVIRQVGADFGLDSNAVEESLSQNHLPLVEEYTNEIFVVLHGFASGDGGRLATPETDIFIGRQFLITVRSGERASIEAMRDRLDTDNTLPVSSPAGLMAFLAMHAGRRYSALIPELEVRVDSLEEMAIKGDPQTAVEVHALRRDIIYLTRAIGPQFDVIEDLSESTHPALDPEARLMFSRVASQHRRAVGSLESGRALLGSVLETYRGAVADQTNEIMRVLTVFSAILLPLSLIAGLWGMNFIQIPGADQRYGFLILVGIMAAMAVGVWIYFARRGFIGAPRLKDLPKAVGLGLFNVGTAPIRVVAGGIKQLGRTEDNQV